MKKFIGIFIFNKDLIIIIKQNYNIIGNQRLWNINLNRSKKNNLCRFSSRD